jgi:CO/xanthine dehydrogenase FAD-binding subunit
VHVFQPSTLEAALRTRREVPDAVVVAGGTEVMPARNQGRRPGPLLDLSRVDELRTVGEGTALEAAGDRAPLRLGAGLTCTQLIEELAEDVPALATAARTVGSRQIRNRATLGGALALADPSADLLAALLAIGAEVEASSLAGSRVLALDSFLTGPYACDLRPEELVTAVWVRPARGPAAYAKVGARNAMARAACAVAVVLDLEARSAGIALVGVGPTPVRARVAEEFVGTQAAWDQPGGLDTGLVARIGALAARESAPRSDCRGAAAYKRHAAAILTSRALARVWRARTGPAWV